MTVCFDTGSVPFLLSNQAPPSLHQAPILPQSSAFCQATRVSCQLHLFDTSASPFSSNANNIACCTPSTTFTAHFETFVCPCLLPHPCDNVWAVCALHTHPSGD